MMAFVSETALFASDNTYNEANAGSQSPCVSPTGDFLYFLTDAQDSIIKTTLSGASPTVLSTAPVTVVRVGLSVSFDGTKILFSGNTGNSHDEVYVMNTDGTGITALTSFGRFTGAMHPSWKPDGTKIVFNAYDVTTSHVDMYTMNANGSGQTAIIVNAGTDSTISASWGINNKLLFVGTIAAVTNLYTSNTDGTGMAILAVDLPAQTGFGTPLWNAAATEIYYWSHVSSTSYTIARSLADGTSSEVLISGDGTAPGPSIDAAGLSVTDDEGHVYYVVGEFGIYAGSLVPLGISFAQFDNDNNVDWSRELGSDRTVGYSFSSFFISGYKLRGEGIRKFQTNYLKLFMRDPTECDFAGRWDYTTADTSGRFTQVQRLTVSDTDRTYTPKRLKVRGRGDVLQIKILSVDAHPFDIIGWTTMDSVNKQP